MWLGFFTHTRRPARRRTTSSSGTSISSAAVRRRSSPSSASRQRVGLLARCAGSRRAGSRRAASPLADALDDHADDHLVGHELAGVHVALGLAARARCPAATCARSMSPVEMCGSAKSSRRRSACVPLPAPGGPSRIRFSSDKTEAAYPLRRSALRGRARRAQAAPATPARYFRKPS